MKAVSRNEMNYPAADGVSIGIHFLIRPKGRGIRPVRSLGKRSGSVQRKDGAKDEYCKGLYL